MAKASGIGYDLEDEEEYVVPSILVEGLDGAPPAVVPNQSTSPIARVLESEKEPGDKQEVIRVRDAALHFYDLRMAELDASCDDDLDSAGLPRHRTRDSGP